MSSDQIFQTVTNRDFVKAVINMKKVLIQNWKENFDKVLFTKIQMELLNIRLKEAKNNTDTLIDSDILIIEVEDDAIASFKNKINSSVDVFIIED